MDLSNPVNPQASDEQSQGQQIPSAKPKVGKNYWKLGFFIALLLWLSSVFVLVVYFKNNEASLAGIGKESAGVVPTSTVEPTSIAQNTAGPTTTLQGSARNISVRIDPYRTEIKDNLLMAIFQVTNLNDEVKLDKVTYWTDKSGACQAKTQPFSEFVEIPVDGVDYSFFQFTDTGGDTSQIYASSHGPIFQCGSLAQ